MFPSDPRSIDARVADERVWSGMSRVIRTSPGGYPMAPSHEEWELLSEDERRRLIAELPNSVTDAEMSPPEGDLHFRGKVDVLEALRSHFQRKQRKVYLAS